MLVELIQATARDGVRLDGTFRQPADAAPRPLTLDACCLIHGTGGNFYNSTLLEALAQRLLGLGCAVLIANTRGHDGISNAVRGPSGIRQGAAYEVVDDCRHDLAAWTSWLRERCGPRVAWLGHSLGAVKCLYARSQEPQLAPAGIIAVSPPRLSYSWFCAGSAAAEFLATYQQAAALVEAGQPTALLEVRFPLPFVITAAGYVEKYGPDERYNYLRVLNGFDCPTLLTLGEKEASHNPAFQGIPEAITDLSRPPSRLRLATIPGADHFYSGVREPLVATLEAWLREQFTAP
ncbi:MAG: alpha/beta fold hydrolase [Planctomycetia bacterium]|nr:alpha/beta fold hydrolase [Planctomycetia bacterium]